MIKLNRTTEYSLLALSYIRGKSDNTLTSTREIADYYSLPFEILAKTLQKLKEQGIVSSTYGTRGGYLLAKDLGSINLAEFLRIMEGPLSIVSCATHPVDPDPETGTCEYSSVCGIKKPMSALNARINDFLSRISVEELTREEMIRSRSQSQTIINQCGVTTPLINPMGEEP